MAKNNQTVAEPQEEVKKLSAAQWIEKNANAIMWALLAVLIVVGGVLVVVEKVIKPKKEQAAVATVEAYNLFEAGNYEEALKLFAEVAGDYNNQEGKLAALYAGLCSYNLGQYEEAVEYMKDFDADDLNIAPAVKMHIGDAYVELGELEQAAKAFKAAADSKNEIIAPAALKKAGIVYLELNDAEAAKKAFEAVKNDYPQSMEAQDIEKYIAVAE